MTPELGLIEGYYGLPWDWASRERVMRRLAGAGYRFFMYAPKADAFLRRVADLRAVNAAVSGQ